MDALKEETRETAIATAILRASIESRCQQAGMTLAAMVLNTLFSVVLLGRGVDGGRLAVVLLASTGLLLVRYMIAHRGQHTIAGASAAELTRIDRLFRAVSFTSQVVNGALIWIIWRPDIFDHSQDEISAYVMTLMICLYATGTMVNLSHDYRSFRHTIPLLMGQPTLFWLLSGAAGIAIGVILIGLTVLMISSVRNSQRVFEETVRIRFEKDELLEQVAQEKEIAIGALQQAESANRSKSFFMAAAAHDLRQPLYAATLLADTMALHALPDDAASLLAKQSKALAAASGLFDNLLDLSRFEAGAIRPTLVNIRLADLLHEIETEFSLMCRAKGLTLTVDAGDDVIESDYNLLDRMVRNIVGNSVRYTSHGGVHLSCKAADRHVTLTITDTGIGIPPGDQERIFKEYVQLHDTKHAGGKGVGLGLAIVRHIALLLDHPVSVESRAGEGTRMNIQLHRSLAAVESREEPAPPANVNLSGRHVWIVEDDCGVRDALRDYFTTRGCQCNTASSRLQIEELWRNALATPDYVLVDDMLGVHESGLDLANWLATHMSPARILVMTGNTDPTRRRELETSAFKVRTKPILTLVLNDWVRQIDSPATEVS